MRANGSSQLLPEAAMDDSEYAYSDEIIAAVDSGNKIEAIKRLREETGLGLKEAKDAIDALVRERRGDPAVAVGMSEEGGAGGMIRLIIVVAVLLAAYVYFFSS
jgi:hypothetical protein